MRARGTVLALLFSLGAHAGCSNLPATCSGPCTPDLASPPDPNADAGVPADAALPPGDLGPCCDLATGNPAGPWPTAALTTYGVAQGLTGEVIDSSADDAQNIWAVTSDALYVLRPGTSTFLRFTQADGLHIEPFTDPNGAAAVTHITAVAGGGANQAFVGHYGYESDNRLADTVEHMRLGQAEKVTLLANGRIQTLKYEFRCDYGSSWCWENRSARRMLFAHTGVAAGHLFIGFDHGITHVFNDRFGDHIHVEAWYHYPDGHTTEKIGEQYGLAILPNGDLVTGSAYGVGVQQWNVDPHHWVDGQFKWAFTTYGPGAPYNGGVPHSLDVPADYREDQRGAAVTPDGTMWFASLTHGLAAYNPTTSHGNFAQIRNVSAPGLPSSGLTDLAADTDGTLWLIDVGGVLYRFDPAAGSAKVWPGISEAQRLVMDTTVTPRALYVSVGGGGLAVIRAK